jgi:hypothetical protein
MASPQRVRGRSGEGSPGVTAGRALPAVDNERGERDTVALSGWNYWKKFCAGLLLVQWYC